MRICSHINFPIYRTTRLKITRTTTFLIKDFKKKDCAQKPIPSCTSVTLIFHWCLEMLAESIKFLNILTLTRSQYFEVHFSSPATSLSFHIATFQSFQIFRFLMFLERVIWNYLSPGFDLLWEFQVYKIPFFFFTPLPTSSFWVNIRLLQVSWAFIKEKEI